MEYSAIRAIINIESSEHFYDYSGIITKTLIYSINKEISLLHGIRGVLQPLVISPPFTIGKNELEIGETVTPQYEITEKGKWELKPVLFNGEYIFHIGGESSLIKKIMDSIGIVKNPFNIKIHNSIVTYKLEKIEDVTQKMIRNTIIPGKIKVYLKSPAMIFNVFSPSRLPKFSPSAIETLMTPFMFSIGIPTMTNEVLIKASNVLGQLVETWYSINTIRPIMIPFKEKREVAMIGYITYITDTNDENRLKEIAKVLSMAEILGIGESRQNGFGVVSILP